MAKKEENKEIKKETNKPQFLKTNYNFDLRQVWSVCEHISYL